MTTPLVVLGGYLVLLLVLGTLSWSRRVEGDEDYYLAGRKQGWVVSALTIMATFFSSWALLGAPGAVYEEGLIFALFALNVPVSGACVWVFGRGIGREGRKHGWVTPGDMVAGHYGGEVLRSLVALTCMLYVVPYVVMQIQAGGLLIQTLIAAPLLSGVDNFTLGAIALASVTTVYIMIGGMRSVAWTDVVQGSLLVVGMLLGGYVVVRVLGGVREFGARVSELPEAWLTAPGTTGTWTPLFLLSVCAFGSVGSMVAPAQWMRYYAASSSEALRRSALVFALVLTACFLFGVMLVGIGGQVLYPCPTTPEGAPVFEERVDASGAVTGRDLVRHESVEKSDQILLLVLRDQLPLVFPTAGAWLASILIVAIAAGSMSTADSNLHALSAVLVRDVYGRWIRPRAAPREREWAGRLVIFLATGAALVLVVGAHGTSEGVLARSMRMIVNVGILAISFSAQLIPIAVDVLWLRRGTGKGAAAGLAAGLLVTFVAWRLGGRLEALVGVRLMHGAWGFAANVAVFALVSAATSRSPRAARGGG